MEPSTSWDPWPRPVTRESVGTQECTQIGKNGLSGLFWGIRVHCCDSRGSRTRPGERRSVHKSAKMASRHRFWSFVYTVATREGHARVTPPLGWRLCRGSNPHKPPRSPLWRLDNKYRDPSAQGSVAFGSSGASGASRDAPGSLSGPVPDDLHDLLAQGVPNPHESEAHYRRDVAEHVELDELPEPPRALGPIPEGYASSPSLRGASRRQRLGSD